MDFDEDVNLIEQLDLKLKQQQEDLRIAQERYKQKQELRTQKQEAVLKKKLEEIEANVVYESEARYQLQNEMMNRKTIFQEKEKMERKLRDELFELERQQEIESLAVKRSEMFALLENKSRIDKIVEFQAFQLEAITEEETKRDNASVENLSYLLRKAEILEREFLSGNYDEKTKAKIAGMFYDSLETSEASKDQAFRLVDELSSKLKQRYEKSVLDAESNIQTLNSRRLELLNEQSRLAKSKREFELLKSKGNDFLTEVELGNAPPLKFLFLNSLDAALEEFNSIPAYEQICLSKPSEEEVLSRTKKLNDMKAQFEVDSRLLSKKEYHGEFGISSYNDDQLEDFFLIRSLLVDKIIPSILVHICNELEIDTLGIERAKYIELKNKIAFSHSESLREHSVVHLFKEILEEVIYEGAKSIHSDLSSMHNISSELAKEAVMIALEDQPDYASNRDLISQTYDELVKQRNATEFRYVHLYHMNRITIDPTSIAAYSIPDSLMEKLKTSKQIQKSMSTITSNSVLISTQLPPANDIKLLDSIVREDGVTKLESAEEYRLRKLGNFEGEVAALDLSGSGRKIRMTSEPASEDIISEDVKEFELFYMANVRPESISMTGIGSNFTCVKGSSSGKLVACGNKKGGVCLWKIEHNNIKSFCKMVRYVKESNSSIPVYSVDIMTNDTHILTLDAVGTCTVWSCLDFSGKGTIDVEENSFGQTLSEIVSLTTKEYYRTTTGEMPSSATLEKLTPLKALFYPCISWIGYQPSIWCCLYDGTMVRYNTLDSSVKNKSIVAYHSQAGKEQISPIVLLRAKENKVTSDFFVPSAATLNYVNREFFQDHTQIILCIHFSMDGRKIVSVDVSGKVNVWNYLSKEFTGFGWFLPSKSFVIDTVECSFLPSTLPDSTQVLYPIALPEEDPKAPLHYAVRERLIKQAERQYQSTLDSLQLEKIPIIEHTDSQGFKEIIYLPLHAASSKDSTVLCHSFLYAIKVSSSESVTQYEEKVSRHVAIKFNKKERRAVLIDAKFSSTGLDLVVFCFFPPMFGSDKPGVLPLTGFEARLQFRVLRFDKNFDLRLTNFVINIPIPASTVTPPSNISFFLSPVYDVPGTDFLFFIDESTALHIYSISTGQKVNSPVTCALPSMLEDKLSQFSYSMFTSNNSQCVATISNCSNLCSLMFLRDFNPSEAREVFNANFISDRFQNPDYLHSRLLGVPTSKLVRPTSYFERHKPSLLSNPNRMIAKIIKNLINKASESVSSKSF